MGAVESVGVVADVPWGPHWAVQLKVRAALRSAQCRKLVVPRPLPLDKLAGGVAFDGDGWPRSLARADALIDCRIHTSRVLGVPCCGAPSGVSPLMAAKRAELGARLARVSYWPTPDEGCIV
jgi:hypothetical protein